MSGSCLRVLCTMRHLETGVQSHVANSTGEVTQLVEECIYPRVNSVTLREEMSNYMT